MNTPSCWHHGPFGMEISMAEWAGGPVLLWPLPLRRLHVWVVGAAVAVWSWVTIWAAWASQPVSSAAVGASS